MYLILRLFMLVSAYLVGSFPTALIYSRRFHRQDIREVGDGNMGARNTKRNFGFEAGAGVALVDITKGVLLVWIARNLDLSLFWQIAIAAAVILGHDFPIFARFKGGQGLAVTTGAFLGFFPWQTLTGFLVFLLLFAILRNTDIAASVGMGLVVLLQIISRQPTALVIFSVCALLFIPLKKWLDRNRRAGIRFS